jgi:hypothetical protein
MWRIRGDGWLARVPHGALIIPALAGFIAVKQVIAAKTGTLTPWKGGGFGMFASTDANTNRFILVTALDDKGSKHVVRLSRDGTQNQSALSARALGRLQSAPTSERASRLAHALIGESFTRVPPSAAALPRRAAASETYGPALERVAPALSVIQPGGRTRALEPSVPVHEIAVRVVRLRFNAQTGIVTVAPLGPVAYASLTDSARRQ